MVERTFSWFGRNRRFAKDFENLRAPLDTLLTLGFALRPVANSTNRRSETHDNEVGKSDCEETFARASLTTNDTHIASNNQPSLNGERSASGTTAVTIEEIARRLDRDKSDVRDQVVEVGRAAVAKVAIFGRPNARQRAIDYAGWRYRDFVSLAAGSRPAAGNLIPLVLNRPGASAQSPGRRVSREPAWNFYPTKTTCSADAQRNYGRT